MYTVEQVIEAGLKAGLYAYQLDQLEKCLEELPKLEPQQLLQQTPCTTLREYVAQKLSYVMQRPLSSITDGQKMAYNDVLLAIDRPELNIVLPPVA